MIFDSSFRERFSLKIKHLDAASMDIVIEVMKLDKEHPEEGWVCGAVVENLPSMHQDLSSISSTRNRSISGVSCSWNTNGTGVNSGVLQGQEDRGMREN